MNEEKIYNVYIDESVYDGINKGLRYFNGNYSKCKNQISYGIKLVLSKSEALELKRLI